MNVAIQVSKLKGIAKIGNNVLSDHIITKGPNTIIAISAISITRYFKFSILLSHIKKLID